VNTRARVSAPGDVNVLTIDRIRFGDFEFDRLNRLLYRDGAELSLPPRAVGVLSCLIDRPGQIVPKQVLLDEVWKDANVTETSLTEAVSLLRQALVDDPQRPTFIQTVPRRGYRFVAAARVANGAASATADESLPLAAVSAVPEVAINSAPAVTASTDSPPVVEEPAWPAWLPWMFVAAMIGVMSAIILAVIRQPSSYARPVVRFGIELPAGVELARDGASLALSRDGRRVAFVARAAGVRGAANATGAGAADAAGAAAGGGGAPRIYVRDADRLDPTVLEGTDGASSPFFSPDARWIGFFAGGALKKVPVAGGPVVTLCEARAPLGAVWSTRRFCVFASSLTGGLSRIHEDGGTPTMLTAPDAAAGEVRHAWPDLMPDDAGIVFAGLPLTGGPEAARVGVLSFDTGRVQTLVEAATSPHVAPTGHLLFARDRTVFAAPFDPETLEILGQAVPVLDDVATADAADTNAVSQFVVAPGGHAAAIRLAHPESAATYRWVRLPDASAEPVTAVVPFPPREVRWLALSPDGSRLAIARGDGHRSEIWTSDASGGALQRLTTDGQNIAPIWTADSRRIIYASRQAGQDGAFSLFAKTVGEAAAAAVAIRATPPAPSSSASSSSASSSSAPSASGRQAAAAETVHQQFPASVTADGLVYVDVDTDGPPPRTGLDLWLLPWTGGAPQPLVRTAADETSGVISPDGRWLAYQSNASGVWTAMIASATPHPSPLPASGARGRAEPVAVANTDGARLAWSPDGRYLLFTRDSQLWQAPVASDTQPGAGAGEPRLLASDVDASGGLGVTPDGRILVRTREAAAAGQTRLELVLDWSRELNAKVPIKPRPARTVR
jgi:serine/threonine-protein kinase